MLEIGALSNVRDVTPGHERTRYIRILDDPNHDTALTYRQDGAFGSGWVAVIAKWSQSGKSHIAGNIRPPQHFTQLILEGFVLGNLQQVNDLFHVVTNPLAIELYRE